MATTTTPTTLRPQPAQKPQPLAFDVLARRFGMTKAQVYALALFEALAEQYQHQPRHVSRATWQLDSRSEPGTVRTVTQVGNRLLCNCPAAHGDEATNRSPRICSHTAAVHLLLCKQLGIEPPVRPMPPWILQHDPAPEAKAALALIARPRRPKTQPIKPPAATPEPIEATVAA